MTKRRVDKEPNALPKRQKSDKLQHSTIRVKLNTVVTQAGQKIDIQTAVEETNRAVFEACVLANYYVVSRLERGLGLAPLNQSFYYRCLCEVTHLKGIPTAAQAEEKATVPDLSAIATEFRAARADEYAPVERSFRTGLFQSASQRMALNA